MTRFRAIGLIAAALYIATIYAANYAIQHYGVVPVGLGLVAPAGVYCAGLAFGLRDIVQRNLGLRSTLIAIALGIAASYTVSPTFALASAAAFTCSELADLGVYTALERRGWTLAVATSNVVGLVIDSVIFLWLAFGSLAFLNGQIVGKLWVTGVTIAIIAAAKGGRALLPRNA